MLRVQPFRKLCARALRSSRRKAIEEKGQWTGGSRAISTALRQYRGTITSTPVGNVPLVGPLRTPGGVRTFSSLPSYTPVKMPALSPTMQKGTIASWKKQEGDQVTPGDLLAEVETDKATVDFECQDEGYLAKILVPEGTADVPLGKLVAVMVEDESDVAAFKDVSASDLEAEVEGGGAAQPEASSSSSDQGATQEQASSGGQTEKSSDQPKQEASQTTASSGTQPSTPAPAGGGNAEEGRRVFASPLARKIARESNLSIHQLAGRGTGPHGRIIRSDVEAFLASGEAEAVEAVTPSGEATPIRASASQERPFVDVGITDLQQQLAQRLTASKRDVPHFYLTSEISIDSLLQLRERLNNKLGEEQELSLNDFILKAATLSMDRVPEVNASWLDEGYIRFYEYVDINLSMASSEGTVAPVIQDTQSLGLSGINNEISSLKEKVDEDSLQSQHVDIGTFSVVNVGAYGIRSLNPIITTPQACALGVGAATERIVPNDEGDNQERPYKVVTGVNVTLSCDHRVVDGAVGAQWLQVFKNYLEDPETMLL